MYPVFSRSIYFIYYLKQLNWSLLKNFKQYVMQQNGQGSVSQWKSIITDSFKFNISILEYYQFRFYEKQASEKQKWAGTGFMYEYQKLMNPLSERGILDDKRQFFKKYHKWIIHPVADISALESNPSLADKLLTNPAGKLVFKVADGKCGATVEIKSTNEFNPATLLDYLKKSQFDLVEAFILQHSDINALSPSAVNTVRVISQLNINNEIELLGCRLRISVNSPVDNLAAGNLAAPIDEKTGIIYGPAVYSDITKEDCETHPVTSKQIIGFKVPYWSEILKMVNEAHLAYPQNRSIGWDIVVTEDGPGFIEGNHDWCKLLWQLPEKRGMKEYLEKYRNNYVG